MAGKNVNNPELQKVTDFTNVLNRFYASATGSTEDGYVIIKELIDYILTLVPGGGDMLKFIYDTNDSGVVDDSELVNGDTVDNNSSVLANTAKTTNATHSGEVTGSGALTIASGVVDNDNLETTLANRITANDAKVSYTDASDVGLNTTHRSSDGKNHSDVVTNNAKISYTDASDVSANTTFRTTPSTIITAGTNLSWDGNTLNATGGGGVAWGAISGTLSDQTDLQGELNAKQDTITNSDDITEGSINLFLTTIERANIATNNAKNTNVSTDLSFSRDATTVTVESSDGNNAILPEANTTNAGILGSNKWDEIVANTAKISYTDASDVSANTSARHTHSNMTVLNATTASFLTADETKLDGIEDGAQVNETPIYDMTLAVSDLTTDLTTGTSKASFIAPRAFTLTEVIAALDTVATGSTFNVDINANGTSVLSTIITIDASEGSSITAATPPVITTSAISKGDKITIDIDQIGSTIAGKGLTVYLLGTL